MRRVQISAGDQAFGFSLVVPLFDEQERLPDYGQQLVDFVAAVPGRQLFFVDDGSTDQTAELVEGLVARNPAQPVQLLRRAHHGKGAAVSAGLRAAQGRFAGFCDLDLSTPLGELERVLHVAARADVLAIGSRDLASSRLIRPEGPVRVALGRLYNRLLQATLTPGIVDTQCGAKVAPLELWRAVLPWCEEQGFAWDAEVIAVARALNLPVEEVPVMWRHDERSKVRVARDGAAMVAATARIRRRAARAKATDHRGTPHGELFADHNAELLAQSDRDHWWFRSKAALVSTALRQVAPRDRAAGWLVDLGAGSGGVTAMLGWDPERTLIVEGNRDLVAHARQRHGLAAIVGAINDIPVREGRADVVCLVDVIEHVDDPVSALREARRILAPSGNLIVNVPAHRWLWSQADEVLGHRRRYTRTMLRLELVQAGFRPVTLTHVFSWLVPPVTLKRRLAKRGGADLGLDQTSPVIDRVAMVLTALERGLIGRVSLPFGTSVLCVARPEPSETSSTSAGELRSLRPAHVDGRLPRCPSSTTQAGA